MKKKLLIIVIFYFALIISSYGAASSGSSGSSNYDKGATIIKKFDAIKWKQEIEIIINNSIRVSENNIMKVKNNFSWKLSAEVLIQKINSIMK